jgi:hypothetical protein
MFYVQYIPDGVRIATTKVFVIWNNHIIFCDDKIVKYN